MFFQSSLFAAKPLQIIFTANRFGEIEPCHCQDNQIGGLGRLLTFIEKAKKEFEGDTFFIDAGDTFFTLPAIPEALSEKELSKAELIAQSLKLMGLDFMEYGERDSTLGVDVLAKLLQMTHAKNPPPSIEVWTQLLERGGVKLGIVVPRKALALETQIQKLKSEGAEVVILLSHLGMAEDKKLAELNPGSLILGSHSLEGNESSKVLSKSLRVEPEEGGKKVARLRFLEGDVMQGEIEVFALDSSYDQANAVTKLMKNYFQSDKKKTQKKESFRKEVKTKKSFVANPFLCKTCHEKQFTFWKNTDHASAYLVLYAQNRNFDASCVQCHSLGLNSEEGFSKITEPLLVEGKSAKGSPFVESFMTTTVKNEKPPFDPRKNPSQYKKLRVHLMDSLEKLHAQKKLQKVFLGVQCENCHGNRSEHLLNAEKGSPTLIPQNCITCHRAPNAPKFTDDMIAKASCPKG